MREPTFDSDGYPTDATLEHIEKWDDYGSPRKIMDFIRKAWSYPDRFVEFERKKHFTYYLSTGGWSGNESIICAMQKNFLLWHLWVQSKRGGHYWFRIPKNEQAKGI